MLTLVGLLAVPPLAGLMLTLGVIGSLLATVIVKFCWITLPSASLLWTSIV